MLRAKQIGLTMMELDNLEEGIVLDLLVESGNDLCSDEYAQVATQADMNDF